MSTGLERPPWDTSKQDVAQVSPADKENREWLDLITDAITPERAAILRRILGIDSLLTNFMSDETRLRAAGWRADGSNLTLAQVYGTLQVAKIFFPLAQSADEFVDGCALEKVLLTNQRYFGRAAIKIPHGGTKISREINTTGLHVSIEGSGSYATQLIAATPGMVVFRHGLGDVMPGPNQPPDAPFEIKNLRLIQEAPNYPNGSPGYLGSVALDISYRSSVGVGNQTKICDVIFHRFELPAQVKNPCRGMLVDNVATFGPDGTCQNQGSITVITNRYCDTPSGGLTVKSLKSANYRDALFVWMQEEASEDEADHRSIEGVNIQDITAQNGWLAVRVANQCSNPDYRSALWSIIQSDGQGGTGGGVYMERCSHVTIKGGFWVENAAVAGVVANPVTDSIDPVSGQEERRYFDFRSCTKVVLEDLGLNCGSAIRHCFVHTDIGCEDINIIRASVTDYSNTASAGFRLNGAKSNTTKEIDTNWYAWGSGESKKVIDVSYNQISTTNADRAGGTVDAYGEYNLRGKFTGTTDSSGKMRVNIPVRAEGGHPFFIGSGAPFFTFTPQAAGSVPAGTLVSPDNYGFTVDFGNTFGTRGVDISWIGRGK